MSDPEVPRPSPAPNDPPAIPIVDADPDNAPPAEIGSPPTGSPFEPAPGAREPPIFAEPPVIAPVAEQSPKLHPFLFHGSESEYFRIWIVNTLLTFLTFGVYAAWAKVRKRRYLRGNTELMGHRFDYRADPRRLLIGNIIIVVLFLAYALFGEVYPSVRIGVFVVGAILLPWVVVRSLAFNAFNTAYRGMRFTFRQTYGWTAMVYLGQFLFVVLTCGIYYPAWIRNRRELVVSSPGSATPISVSKAATAHSTRAISSDSSPWQARRFAVRCSSAPC